MTPVFDWPKIEPLVARHSYVLGGNKAIRIDSIVRDLHGHVTPDLRKAYIIAISDHLLAMAAAGMPHTEAVCFVGDGAISTAKVARVISEAKAATQPQPQPQPQSPIGTESDYAPDDSRT